MTPLSAEAVQIDCPYCGERVTVIVDGSIEQQQYIEDCSVCCRPMELTVTVTGDAISVHAHRDDE